MQIQNTQDSIGGGTSSIITEIGRELREAFRRLIEAVPGSPARPMQLAETLGLKKDLSSRVFTATRTREPLAVAHLMPGPEALRRLVAAARKKRVPADVLARAEAAISGFDELIRDVAGDRAALDGIIGAWLPDAREKVEMLAKQAVYRGASVIKGCASETYLAVGLLHPCSDGKHLDGAVIETHIGVRRLNANAVVKFATHRIHAPTENAPLTLDGEPIQSSSDVLLPSLCAEPIGHMTHRQQGNVTHFLLGDCDVGVRSAVNLTIGFLQPCCLTRYQCPTAERRKRGTSVDILVPTRQLIMDTLLHDDAYPGSEPSMFMYDTSTEGVADVNDPARFVDRLSLTARAEFIGRGPESMRISEFPQYVELIEHVCKKRNWDARKFRAYRCRVAYPVYGSQVNMTFDAPPSA